MDLFNSCKLKSSTESSHLGLSPQDAILDQNQNHAKTLLVAQPINKNRQVGQLSIINRTRAKKITKTTTRNFSSLGTTFRVRIFQSSFSFLSLLPITPFGRASLVPLSPTRVSRSRSAIPHARLPRLAKRDDWGRVS